MDDACRECDVMPVDGCAWLLGEYRVVEVPGVGVRVAWPLRQNRNHQPPPEHSINRKITSSQ